MEVLGVPDPAVGGDWKVRWAHARAEESCYQKQQRTFVQMISCRVSSASRQPPLSKVSL